MKTQSLEAPPGVEEFQLQGYRRMTPSEKLSCVWSLNRMSEAMAAARIRARYGPISERELRLRLAALRLDRQTMIEAFDWDPATKGL